MDETSVVAILDSGSAALQELSQDATTVSGFLDLIAQIDALPGTEARFYEESLSLFQAIAKGMNLVELEQQLAAFFGPPDKPAGKPMPVALRLNSSAKYLGGIQKEQSLFIKKTAVGEFYGALWPWQRKKNVITIHLGFCSQKISDADYIVLENLIKKARAASLSKRVGDAPEGLVRGAGLTSFLQMAEMEERSCTLRVTADGRVGLLYMCEGKLIDAKTEALSSREAAYRIIRWKNAEIEILPPAKKTEDAINQPLMHVLKESLKIKDEASVIATQAVPEAEEMTLEMESKPESEPEVPTLRKATPAPPPPRPKPAPAKTDTPPGLRPKSDPKGVVLSKVSAKKRVLVGASVLVLVLVIVAGLVVFRSLQSNRLSKAYDQMLKQVTETTVLEDKESLLLEFIASHETSEYTLAAEEKLEEIADLIEERDYAEMSRQINNLPLDHNYGASALALFKAFEEQYPASTRVAEIRRMIDEMVEMVEDMEYETLASIEPNDLSARLKASRDYLQRYPQGKYRAQVTDLVAGLSEMAFKELKRDVKALEKKRQYDQAIDSCRRYQSLFTGGRRATDVQLLQAGLLAKQDLAALRVQAADKGNDYEAARDLLRDYLSAHPQTSQRVNIEKEIARIDQKIRSRGEWQKLAAYSRNPSVAVTRRLARLQRFVRQNPASPFMHEAQDLLAELENEAQVAAQRNREVAQQRQAQAQQQQAAAQRQSERLRLQRAEEKIKAQINGSQGRYVAAGHAVIRDTQTGLMWATLDSHLALGRCLAYDQAVQYVRSLNNGGYTDWRLPTAAELAGIYKNYPFFPDSGAKWYWTSETFVRGYSRIANVVTTKRETVFKRVYCDLNQCGSARAVRP
jgi:hypothetical protein